MILFGAVIFAVVIKSNDAVSTRRAISDGPSNGQAIIEPSSLKTGELAKLIHKVAEDNHATGLVRSKNQERMIKPFGIDLDYYSTDDSQRTVLAGIMKLLQKNYDAHRAHIQNDDDKGMGGRIHYIRNPQVLEQFKRSLRARTMSSNEWSGLSSLEELNDDGSDDDDDNDNGSNFDEDLRSHKRLERLLRRNAVFRLGHPSEENITGAVIELGENPKATTNTQDLEENVNIIHFQAKDNANDKKTNNNNRGSHFDQSKILNRKIENDDDVDEIKNTWDVITKKDWDTNGNEKMKKNPLKRKLHDRDRNDDKHKDGHKKDKFDDNYRKDDNLYKVGYKDNGEFKENYKKDTYNDDHKKDKYDNYKKDRKYDDNYNNGDQFEDNSKKDKHSDNNYKKNDKSNNNLKSGTEKENHRKKSRVSKEDWNEDTELTKTKNVNWEVRPKPKPFKKTNDRNNKWKNNNVDKPKYKEERKNKDYFDETTTYRTTKDRNSRDDSKLKKSASKISEYYNPKPRIHDKGRGAYNAFGRTSIPFVGKKGIYEDK